MGSRSVCYVMTIALVVFLNARLISESIVSFLINCKYNFLLLRDRRIFWSFHQVAPSLVSGFSYRGAIFPYHVKAENHYLYVLFG